jgi:antagonist of KipI
MDVFALQALNAIVGNANDSAGLEWALGGGSLRFDERCVFAIGGASARARMKGAAIAPFTAVYAEAGTELIVETLFTGRFLYFAVAGGIRVSRVMESSSTYLPGRFGGFKGRMIAREDSLPVGDSHRPRGTHPVQSKPHVVPAEGFSCPSNLLPRYDSPVIRITRGTHAGMFGAGAWATLTGSEFSISSAADRTGYRLKGPTVENSIGNLPSDPSCFGAIQVPADGAPIVLMADAPTVGGYPKIAVVAEADLPILAQRSPGDVVRFELVTIEDSQRALGQRLSDLRTISSSGAASAS